MDEATDRQLLERFVVRGEESAFAVLVERHGPMVLSVCYRLLRNDHDAEDAFQATFFVLARRAGSLRWHESVGSWLYEVAWRVARKARADSARRQLHERKTNIVPSPDPLSLVAGREIETILQEELCRLPPKYRLPVVLCCLEGASRSEAARQLGWREGTVAGRLARARNLLQKRLARRGVTIPANLLTTALTEKMAGAAVPAVLAEATLKAASRMVAGHVATATPVSGTATALANQLLRVMFLTKVKIIALTLTVAATAAGTGLLAHRTLAGKHERTNDAGAPGPVTRRAAVPMPEHPRQARTDLYGDPLPPGALVRMGTIRLRHSGNAAAAFSADGKTLISASRGLVRFWDPATGEPLHRKLLEPPGGGTFSLSPDGKILVTRGEGELQFWDVQEGKEHHRVPVGRVNTTNFAWAADGKTLAAVTSDLKSHSVHLWDVWTGKEYPPLEHKDRVGAIALSPDGQVLASVSGLDTIGIFEIGTSRELRRISEAATALAFSADGKNLASGDSQGTVKFWHAVTGRERAALSVPTVGKVYVLCFSQDSRTLAVGGFDGFSLCDVPSCRELHHMAGLWAGWIAFAPDGKTAVSSGAGRIQLWDVATGIELLSRPSHHTEVNSIAFAPDGKILASACGRDGTIRLWESATAKPVHLLQGHERFLRGIDFSADGKFIVSGGSDGTFRFWDVGTGKELRSFAVDDVNGGLARPESVTCRLSPDGTRLVAISMLMHYTTVSYQLDAWDTRSGNLVTHRPFSGDIASCLSPDGRSVAVQTDKGLAIQEVATGREFVVIPVNLSAPVAFSTNGKDLAATIVNDLPPRVHGPDGSREGAAVGLWDLATGKELLRLETGPVGLLAFSPDGRLLATAGLDAIRVWDGATGKVLYQVPPHASFRGSRGASFVTSMAFSADGKTVATGFPDGTVLIWDLEAKAALQARVPGTVAVPYSAAGVSRLAGDYTEPNVLGCGPART
jgi:RNA polymerase sigma factor (sigma-70 family)